MWLLKILFYLLMISAPCFAANTDFKKVVVSANASGTANESIPFTVYMDNHFFCNDNYEGGSCGYHYDGTYNRTYIVFSGPCYTAGKDGDVYITWYDHDSLTFCSKPYRYASANTTLGDMHGQPDVVVLDNGKILSTFGGHTTPAIRNIISTNAEDITAWSAAGDLVSGTYSKLIKASNGDVYCIYRPASIRNQNYIQFNDSTLSWGSEITFINFSDYGTSDDSVYLDQPKYRASDNSIYFTWFWYTYETSFRNVYFARLDLDDGHVYDIEGDDAGTEITRAEAHSGSSKFLAYSSSVDTGWPNFALDENGYPHITFSLDDGGGSCDMYYLYWNGSAWSSPAKICDSYPHTYPDGFSLGGSPAIEIYSTSNIDVLCLGSTGDIEKWTFNGSSWAKTATIIDKDRTNEGDKDLFVSGLIENPDSSLKYLMVQMTGDYDPFPYNRAYAYGENDFARNKGSNILSCNNKCKTDFGDVKFLSSNKSTELGFSKPFHVISSGVAEFWVKIPESLESNSYILYLSYGDNALTTTGDWANAFPFCDAWDNASLNTTNWPSVDGNPVYSINTTSNYLEITDCDEGTNLAGKGFHSKTFTYPLKWKIDDPTRQYVRRNDNYYSSGVYRAYTAVSNSDVASNVLSAHHTTWGTSDYGVAWQLMYDAWADDKNGIRYTGVAGNYHTGSTLGYGFGINWYFYATDDNTTVKVYDNGTERESRTNSETPDRVEIGVGRDTSRTFGTTTVYPLAIMSGINYELFNTTEYEITNAPFIQELITY